MLSQLKGTVVSTTVAAAPPGFSGENGVSGKIAFFTGFNVFLVYAYSDYKLLSLSLLHGIRKVCLFSVKFVFVIF